MTVPFTRPAAWASAGLLLVVSSAAVGADRTRTESWNGSASIDGGGYTTVGTINISSGEVGSGAVVYSASMSTNWTKTDGSCSSQSSGYAYHNETGIRVTGPAGTVEMVRPGTYSGGTNIGRVTTSYGWANTNTHSGTPSSGTFRPSSGVLRDTLFGRPAVGNWSFQGRDTAGADPLCLYNYTLTLSTTLPPVPRPGSGYTVDEGAGVVLNGSGSTDDGSISLYQWDCGPGGYVTGATRTCTYPDQGAQTATLLVRDNRGIERTANVTVTVVNVAPTITGLTIPSTINEGQLAEMSGTATDPGADTISYAWAFGDGATGTGASTSHTYADDGEQTVTFTVRDEDGGVRSTSGSVAVLNVAPTLVSIETGSPTEGQPVSMSAEGSDVAADTVSYAWDFGDGSTGTGNAPTHTYADEGVYELTLTLSDEDGGATEVARTITVADIAPVITSVDVTPGGEGASTGFTSTVQQAASDTVTYTWDFGDGSPVVSGVDLASTSYDYPSDGDYTARLTVTDDDGSSDVVEVPVSIGNGPPVLTSFTASDSDEGAQANLSASATDPGSDPLTFEWDFGDGSALVSGVDLTDPDHVYADNGVYTVTLTVSDDAGASVSDTRTVTVSNLDPLIAGVDVDLGAEGQVTAFTADVSDVPADPLTYTWDFGDGTPPVAVDGDGAIEHRYAGSGLYTVTLTVTDDDGGSSSTTVEVDIANGAPSIAVFETPGGDEGEALNFYAEALDGSDDTLTYTWDFGDGSDPVSGIDLLEATHTYADDQTYTVTLTVTDDDGESVSESADITINNVAPDISSLTGDLLLDEASTGTWTALATDPGDDTLTYSWSLGDGTDAQDGVDLTDLSAAYADDGTYTLTLTVSDEDGGSTEATLTVVVDAVAPVLESLADLPQIDEGSPIALSASASEPTGATLAWVWTFGDGSPAQQGDDLNSVDHTYGDEGTYQVSVTVTDDDDLSDSTGIEIVVVNVAPSLQGNTPVVSAFEGEDIDFQPTVFEPGDDVLTWTLLGGPEGATVDSETGLVSWTPTYEQSLEGSAEFSISVDDGDGGSDQLDWTVTVYFADVDEDGLADEWELDNGFDPSDPNDGLLDPDGDGRTNVLEFQTDTDPNVYDGPGVPEPVSPRDGETADDSRPTLTWTDAEHPLGEVLVYEAEVYADELLTDLITTLTSQEDALSGRVSDALPENAVVYWRVRGADAFVSGDWSDTVDFFVDGASEAPPTPEPTFPIDGEWLTTTPPVFQWNESVDPDRDAVVYDVEVYDVGDAVVASAIGVEDLSWESDVALDEDTAYTWAVRAVDEDGEMSDWSLPEPFFYSTSDLAPEGLAWTYPVDFAQVDTPSPILTLSQATDPELTEVSTTIELDTVPTYDSESGWSTVLANTEDGTLSWDLAEDGIELPERTLIYARAQAVDESGIASPWVETTLRLGGEDVAPTVPELISPSADAILDINETVTFVLGNSVDADGDAITYTLVVATDAELTDVTLTEADIAETPEGTVSVDLDVSSLPLGVVYWSAEATDSTGLASGFAAAQPLVLGEATAEFEGAGRCGCASLPSPGAAWLFAPLALLGLRRRRR